MWFHPHVNPYDSYCNMHTTCMLQHERMGAWASPPGVENQLLKWCLYRGVGSSGGPKREQGFPSHLGFPSHMGFPTHLGFPNPPSLRQVETSLWPSSTCFLNFGVLPLTRKPSFRSSWNRKLVNFDFLIFFEQKFFLNNFFLVKNYEISDFVDSSYRNMNHFYPFIFSLHERGRLKFYFYQFILKR